VLTGDGPPVVAGGGAPSEIGPPATTATREQLLARDELQRARIAALTARIGELERRARGAGGPRHGGDAMPNGEPWHKPSADTLLAWAKECRVHFDLPPVLRSEPFQLGPKEAEELGVSSAEIAPINAALVEIHRTWVEKIRAIYIEATGDAAAADALSPQAMAQEIEDKSPQAERAAIQARIAQERAGLVPAPTDWSKASPIERYYRALAALGDDTERAFAAKLGPERAAELRAQGEGWPMRKSMAGCPEDDGKAEDTDVR
jgi:hypothetical protein